MGTGSGGAEMDFEKFVYVGMYEGGYMRCVIPLNSLGGSLPSCCVPFSLVVLFTVHSCLFCWLIWERNQCPAIFNYWEAWYAILWLILWGPKCGDWQMDLETQVRRPRVEVVIIWCDNTRSLYSCSTGWRFDTGKLWLVCTDLTSQVVPAHRYTLFSLVLRDTKCSVSTGLCSCVWSLIGMIPKYQGSTYMIKTCSIDLKTWTRCLLYLDRYLFQNELLVIGLIVTSVHSTAECSLYCDSKKPTFGAKTRLCQRQGGSTLMSSSSDVCLAEIQPADASYAVQNDPRKLCIVCYA